MLKSRTLSDEEEFWDCREDSLSYVSIDGESIRNLSYVSADGQSVRNLSYVSADGESVHSDESVEGSGYSGSSSDTDGLQSDLQDFAFEELGESTEVSFWSF